MSHSAKYIFEIKLLVVSVLVDWTEVGAAGIEIQSFPL